MAYLRLVDAEQAARGGGEIGQGCVYVFDGNSMARHE